jgi:hypothetical protein
VVRRCADAAEHRFIKHEEVDRLGRLGEVEVDPHREVD